ncbi:MAG: helix-turn-helix domain-containing protein [Candidatus ainarchaeum sp.]|nr:helix-turn-helix domain-containing protein [Candidatus ainarchaeum sp.]
MDLKILQDIGFTESEVKIYLALLELGESTAKAILEKTNLYNSVLHSSLNRLIAKGFVSYIYKGRMRYYCAAEPQIIQDYLSEKQKQLDVVMPYLLEHSANKREIFKVDIFEGYKGVMNLLLHLIKDSKKGEEFLFFPPNVPELNEDIQKFYTKYDIKRKSKGLVTKGIVFALQKKYFEKRKYLKIKYVDFPIPSDISICGNKMAMISFKDKPRGILIDCEEIVTQHRNFFNSIWNLK